MDNNNTAEINERLRAEIELLKNELKSLQEVTNLLATAGEAQPVFDKVLERAMTLTGASSGSLMLRDDHNLRIVANKGLDEEVVSKTSPKLGEGIAGWVAQHGQPLLIVGKKIESFAQNRPIKDALSVPLKTADKVLGVLNVNSSPDGRDFNQSDLEMLNAFASQAALAVQMLHARQETEDAYLSVIKALAEAIDAKDPYTAGHSQRVSSYAVSLSRMLGLSDKEVKKISLAALMHDIGKIGISEEIIRKTGRLNKTEYGLIRAHPVISAKILEPVSSLQDVLPIIRHHHERVDGQGYPAGLRGDEIPIGSRILAIVDAFDAMASGRSYRKVMSLNNIVKEIRKHRGSQFDSHILDLFMDGINSGQISLKNAVITGQETQPSPMKTDDVYGFLAKNPEKTIAIVRSVSDKTIKELDRLAGKKIAAQFKQSLIIDANGNNLGPIFQIEQVLNIKSPEEFFRALSQYFDQMHRILTEIVGERISDRLLLDAAMAEGEADSLIILMILRENGIVPLSE